MGVEGSEDVSLNLMNDSWVADFVDCFDVVVMSVSSTRMFSLI